jgi:hypothetical protein
MNGGEMGATTDVTPVMIIDRMAEILAKPEGWTKHAYARIEEVEISCKWDRATCFCLDGALIYASEKLGAYGEGLELAEVAIRDTIQERTGRRGLVQFNDAPATTHADILIVLKAVRKRLGGAE